MNKLSEIHSITNLHLSGVQRVVLAKIMASATEQVAHEEISKGRNLVAARDTLTKLGLITVTDSTAMLTDKGHQVMKDEDLADDAGLTDRGREYAEVQELEDLKDIGKTKDTGLAEPTQPEQPQQPQTQEPQSQQAPLDLGFESFDLVREINQRLNEAKIINNLNSK